MEELKKELEQYKAKIKELEEENKKLKRTNEYIFLRYHSCGYIVKSKRTGRYGVVLETMPEGTLMVLESIKPKIILLYDSMDELERTGR